MAKHRMQPVVMAPDGVMRFQSNEIIQWLFRSGKIDLNYISARVQDHGGDGPKFSKDDYAQLIQLMGYSVSGYGDCDCADQRTVAAANRRAAKLIAKHPLAGEP